MNEIKVLPDFHVATSEELEYVLKFGRKGELRKYALWCALRVADLARTDEKRWLALGFAAVHGHDTTGQLQVPDMEDYKYTEPAAFWAAHPFERETLRAARCASWMRARDEARRAIDQGGASSYPTYFYPVREAEQAIQRAEFLLLHRNRGSYTPSGWENSYGGLL